jgi:hypothetical protein
MSNSNGVKNNWENKVLVVCHRCGQNLRIPISYKPLQVTCPKCRNEFSYDYIGQFGNEGEHPLALQIGSISLILGMIWVYLVSFIIFMIAQTTNHFQGWGFLPFPFGLVLFIASGILIATKLIDYKTFKKYRPFQLLVINRQGMIYFNRQLRAEECLNWSDVQSARYMVARHMFAGLIETKQEPACIELEVKGKGKVVVPTAMFFSKEQRLQIMAEILRHFDSRGSFHRTQ